MTPTTTDPLRPFVASLSSSELISLTRSQLATFAADDVHPRQLHTLCTELTARYARLLTLLQDLHGEAL